MEWLKQKEVSTPVGAAIILLVTVFGATKVIEKKARAEKSAAFAAEVDVTEFESILLHNNLLLTEATLRNLAQDYSGNPNLELYCAYPEVGDAMNWGSHKRSPDGSQSLIKIHPLMCGFIDAMDDPSLEALPPDQEVNLQRGAALATFVVAHELGHEELGLSERDADHFAVSHYQKIAELLELPDAVVHMDLTEVFG